MFRPKSVGFIINPHAGSSKSRQWKESILRSVRDTEMFVEIVETHTPEEVGAVVGRLAREVEAVVAVGGDGTAHSVAQELVGQAVPLGVLPNGSGNDFNRMLGMPRGIEPGMQLIIQGLERRSIDTGLLVIVAEDGTVHRRCFVNTAGVGFDAAVAQSKTKIPLLKGLPLYLTSALATLTVFKPLRFGVRHTSGESHEAGMMVAVGIGQYEGGGFRVFPGAVVDDGLFEVCEIRIDSRLRALPMLALAVSGAHVGKAGVLTERSPMLDVVPERPVPVHADGEVVCSAAVKVEMSLRPKSLFVLSPN